MKIVSPPPHRPDYLAHFLRIAAVLLFVVPVLLPLQRGALAQSTSAQQQGDGPPPGPPPSGGQESSSDSSSTSTTTRSQGRPQGPPSPAMELDRMILALKAANVSMTDAQKVAVLGVLEDKQTAMEQLRSQTNRAVAMQQMQALEKAARTAILADLTEAQQKVYLSLRQGPPGPPPSGGNGQSGSGMASGDSNIDANTGGGVPQNAPPPPTQ